MARRAIVSSAIPCLLGRLVFLLLLLPFLLLSLSLLLLFLLLPCVCLGLPSDLGSQLGSLSFVFRLSNWAWNGFSHNVRIQYVYTHLFFVPEMILY